jgi:signal transduction histidine kinase
VTRRLVATYLILAAVVLVALEIPLGVVYERSQRRDLQQRVERDAVALAALVEDTLQTGAAPGDPALARVVDSYHGSTGARVVVVGPGGRLLADSDTSRRLGRDFSTRPEIAVALDGSIATGTRRSDTLGTGLLYVAVPVASGGVVHGAVRASVPTSRLDSLVVRYWLVLGAVALIVLGAVALAGRWLTLWVSRPLTHLRDATRRAEAGDLTVRADDSEGPAEVRELSSAFNDMVSRLDMVVGTQEQFVADASHQLRSPLTALRLRIENLQHEADPAVADDLESAIGEVDRLSRLVNGLLTLAHADRRAPERSRQDVGRLVEERAEAWRERRARGGDHHRHRGRAALGALARRARAGARQPDRQRSRCRAAGDRGAPDRRALGRGRAGGGPRPRAGHDARGP